MKTLELCYNECCAKSDPYEPVAHKLNQYTTLPLNDNIHHVIFTVDFKGPVSGSMSPLAVRKDELGLQQDL